MFLSSALITVHLENLRHNLKTLLARHPLLMPVIKADAYGHGIVAVARVLAEKARSSGRMAIRPFCWLCWGSRGTRIRP